MVGCAINPADFVSKCRVHSAKNIICEQFPTLCLIKYSGKKYNLSFPFNMKTCKVGAKKLVI